MVFHYHTSIPGDDHIKNTPITPISKLSPFSGLIITIVLIILFLLKQYILELFLLRRIYGQKYTSLNESDRRGFLNHHIAGGTKLLILIVGVYPFIDVAFRYGTLNTPYAPGSAVTLGDILLVCTQMLLAMYIFELLYRVRISPISTMHHIGTIIIGQTAVAISLNLVHERDATVEFILCTVWGAFDIVCELLPHVSIVLYRVYPSAHHFLSRVFLISAVTTFGGTLFETAVVMYLFGSLWAQWTTPFKIVTPILHIAFSATQFHGSRVFYRLWRKQSRLLQEGMARGDEEGLGSKKEEDGAFASVGAIGANGVIGEEQADVERSKAVMGDVENQVVC